MLYAQTKADGSRSAFSSEFRRSLSSRLSSMLSSGSSDLGFVAAVHNCCMQLSIFNANLLNTHTEAPKLPAFPVSPHLIGESALRSLSFTTGIRTLEEGLLAAGVWYDGFQDRSSGAAGGAGSSGAPSAATGGRGRISAASSVGMAPVVVRAADASAADIAAAWSQLGQLYDAVKDGEMLQSLVEQSSIVGKTREAIEAELRGELESSLRIYDDLLKQHDDGVKFDEGAPRFGCGYLRCWSCAVWITWFCFVNCCSDEEFRLWETRRLDCLEALGRWDVLCDTYGPDLTELVKPENRYAVELRCADVSRMLMFLRLCTQ